MMHKLDLMGRSWPYMRNHVRLFVRYCPCCQKMSAVRIPINVHKFTTAGEILFDVLNIDFIGTFPDGTHVLVIVDSFSRWIELFHCKDSTVESACRCLLEHFGRFGSPNLIRSDRGPHFANGLIEKFLLAVGTPYNLTLAYSKRRTPSWSGSTRRLTVIYARLCSRHPRWTSTSSASHSSNGS